MAPNEPVRVIYAKLTSTGAYDVVAKTANLPLDRARALAEKLLPGNPPLDAVVGDEVAHLRPPEGGHIVLRFARYDWTDGERGDVFITDIIWVSDDDFGRVRDNAFALVPHTDEVFAELKELAPVVVQNRATSGDLARLAQLRAVTAEAKTVIASTAAAESVLLVHSGDRARAMELFTLLLPPTLRSGLTFQTTAFRVPSVLPRVTLVDRAYANLRHASWKLLPSVDVDVPLELAGRLVALADDPPVLALTHELYEDAYDDEVDLRTGITRLTRLAELADTLQRRDVAGTLRMLGNLEPRVRNTAVTHLNTFADPSALIRALAQLLQQGDESAQHVLPLLRAFDPQAESSEATATLIDALHGDAPDELRAELAMRTARHGDVAQLITQLSANPRGLLAKLPLDAVRLREDVRRLLLALRDATSGRADLDSVARLLEEAHGAHLALPPSASTALHRMCRAAVIDALDRTPAHPSAVQGMRRLQDAAAVYARTLGAAAPMPALLTPPELATYSTPEDALLAVVDHPEPVRVVLGAALLVRAWDGYQGGDEAASRRDATLAAKLLGHASGHELARQVLAERHVQDLELLGMPGADALLPILGGNAPQAAITRRLVAAIATIAAGNETAVADLANAVYAAHSQKIRIRPNTELSQRVLSALHELARAQSVRADTAAAEICVELLAVITEPTYLTSVEDAVLGDGMVVRLHRLDRSIVQCRAAEDEDLYERYARAVESSALPLDAHARERLRDALGTGGLKRRLLRAVSSVVERDAS